MLSILLIFDYFSYINKTNLEPDEPWLQTKYIICVYIQDVPNSLFSDIVALFKIYGLFLIGWFKLEVGNTEIKEIRTVWNLAFWLGWVCGIEFYHIVKFHEVLKKSKFSKQIKKNTQLFLYHKRKGHKNHSIGNVQWLK